jgi:glutamate synthase (NADPH/NADH) small chain
MSTQPPKPLVPEALRQTPGVGRRVAVIGGGDTATDCLRTPLRLGGAEVTCYYRRTEAEIPASHKERLHALEEGAHIEYLAAPVSFQGDEHGQVCALDLQLMGLGERDGSGRRRPIPIPDSDDYGLISADQHGRTSRPGVFAAGDAVTGPDLVSTAAAGGLRAAEEIDD